MEYGKSYKIKSISSYDKNGVKDYFDKNVENPTEILGWKSIILAERLLSSRYLLIRWAGYYIGFFIATPLCLYDEIKVRVRKKEWRKSVQL